MSDVSISTEEFFLNSGSEQLEKIHGWARSRMAAPWAVFAGVLLRVAASVPPHVQLPGVIGDRASLNLLCAFVGPSGAGKGNATKVAARAWPTDILTLPVGSGQGIAETFTKRDPKADIPPVIFDIPEIDTMAGLSSAHGSILLPTIKSLAMGEQLGQANATRDARREVPAHSYRACLSVGAQPGHTDVIFNDATGGTPQRFLWVPVTDRNIECGEFCDPGPLVTDMPVWTPGKDGVVDVIYSDPDITRIIKKRHLDRMRGEGDALDGHATLTRCKVAALLAIMHQRNEVTEWDWQKSAAVVTVSDATRVELVEHAERVRLQRARDAGNTRAAEREGYEDGRLKSVMGAITDRLGRAGVDGMAHGDLRTSISSSYRGLFDTAIEKLADDSVIEVVTVKNGKRYRLKESRQGGDPRQGMSSQFKVGGDACQGGAPDNLVSLNSRRLQKDGEMKVSCQRWFDRHLEEQRERGYDTVEAFAVRAAGQAAGYSLNSLYVAANTRGLKGATWPLTG
ncbi:hypothetical protein [Mycobacterium sp. HM-7]